MKSLFLILGMSFPVFPQFAPYTYVPPNIPEPTFVCIDCAANISEPSYSPSFGQNPINEGPATSTENPIAVQPVSVVQLKLDAELQKRLDRIRKLRGRVAIFKVALERLQSGEDWRTELEYWAQESQASQLGALLTSLALLNDIAGPIQEAIAVHGYNSSKIYGVYLQKNRVRLNEINSLLKSENIGPAKSLTEAHNILVKALRKEVNLRQLFMNLGRLTKKVTDGAEKVELVGEVRRKSELLLAAKLIGEYTVKLLIDSGLLQLHTRYAMTEAAQVTGLGKFAINYGYNSFKFYLSWNAVDDILYRIRKNNSDSTTLSIKITETTGLIKSINEEVKQLQSAKGSDKQSKSVLEGLRRKEIHDAYLAGDWFSQRTGVYAPGVPILKNQEERSD